MDGCKEKWAQAPLLLFCRPHLYTWPRSAEGKLSSFMGPDGLSVSGVDSFHSLTVLQMKVDVWGRISIFIQCMRMAFLDIAVSQKEPLLDHCPSSSKKKKAEDCKDLSGEHLGRAAAPPALSQIPWLSWQPFYYSYYYYSYYYYCYSQGSSKGWYSRREASWALPCPAEQ